MHILQNTRQEEDPNGLQAIEEILRNGKEDDFDRRVSERLPAVGRARTLLARVQKLSPGVEFSPYVMRILNTAEKQESSRLAEVA